LATSEAEFDRAIAVRPSGDRRYAGTVDPGWAAPMGPNGGYLAAMVVRALEAELDPDGERRIRSLTLHYLRPPADGPIEFEVERVREGRRFTTGRVTGRQEGREVLAGIAALSVPGMTDPLTWVPSLPEVDPPGDWLPFQEGRMPELLRRVRVAPRIGSVLFSGRAVDPGVPVTTGGWVELVEPRGIDAALVALCTDVWWPPSLEPLTEPAGVPTIDLTIHFRADLPREPLPDQPLLGVFSTAASVNGTVEEDGVVFAADGTLLAQSRQLALWVPFD
jgi:acyl-CoA thioesterase